MKAINTIGVVGAGTMGHGIAQVAALGGLDVVLIDVAEEALEAGVQKIGKGLDRMLAKEKITPEQHGAALAKVSTATGAEAAAEVDLVVEAVVEKFEVKAQVLSDLDGVCQAETILATNTSSISITRLAAVTSRPAKVIGMHFMNPVPVMKLVEIIRGLATAQRTYDQVESLDAEAGQDPG